jgi:hypothetical protein
MKPNFSGDYVLDRPSSVLSPAAAGMVSAVLRIDSAHERSRCYWDEDTLVSEDRMGPEGAGMIMTWRYKLLSDGRRLRATERIRGAGRDQDNVWEFDRQ